jgi:hypothetical protein
VDQDHCGGGTYCTIQSAVNAATPGTAIRVRNSARPYNETVRIHTSGTAGAPIVLEPEPGHNPILTGGRQVKHNKWGMVSVDDASHIVVRNLTFDGFHQRSAARAISVQAERGNMDNVLISGNTVQHWAGSGQTAKYVTTSEGISFGRNHPYRITNAVARCNTITDSSRGIGVNGTGALIEHNAVKGIACLGQQHFSVLSFTNNSGISPRARGGRETARRDDLIIRHNVIEGPFTGCEGHVSGLWCDVGLAGGQVYNNAFINPVAPGQKGAAGVHIESRCHDWRVEQNLILMPRNVPWSSTLRARNTDGTVFANNVTCGSDKGVWITDDSQVQVMGARRSADCPEEVPPAPVPPPPQPNVPPRPHIPPVAPAPEAPERAMT